MNEETAATGAPDDAVARRAAGAPGEIWVKAPQPPGAALGVTRATRQLTQAKLQRAGRRARRDVPRSAHAHFTPRDRAPMVILREQNETRLPHLVPLRMARMAESPFAFYRGTAALMAADLAGGPSTDIEVVSCGDAHISNFGLFASPQRSLVFDLNDFDEASVAPFEWDLKRLVTSVVIGALDAGMTAKDARAAALCTAAAYRRSLRAMMRLTVLERYYFRADITQIRTTLGRSGQKALDKATRQAAKRTSQAFVDKITETLPDGSVRIVQNPPVFTHVDAELEALVMDLFEAYRQTVPADIAVLLEQFEVTDVVLRVVGVGSVGTRCYVVLLHGPQGESLVLQVKEAQQSVLQSWGGIDAHRLPAPMRGAEFAHNEGFRVVASQRTLQAVSDPFLGYFHSRGNDYYVRQFRDRKGSIDTRRLAPSDFEAYVTGCATLLARAHAQSAASPTVAGYLGRGTRFDEAVTDWSVAYAEQSLADYHALLAAIEAGQI